MEDDESSKIGCCGARRKRPARRPIAGDPNIRVLASDGNHEKKKKWQIFSKKRTSGSSSLPSPEKNQVLLDEADKTVISSIEAPSLPGQTDSDKTVAPEIEPQAAVVENIALENVAHVSSPLEVAAKQEVHPEKHPVVERLLVTVRDPEPLPKTVTFKTESIVDDVTQELEKVTAKSTADALSSKTTQESAAKSTSDALSTKTTQESAAEAAMMEAMTAVEKELSLSGSRNAHRKPSSRALTEPLTPLEPATLAELAVQSSPKVVVPAVDVVSSQKSQKISLEAEVTSVLSSAVSVVDQDLEKDTTPSAEVPSAVGLVPISLRSAEPSSNVLTNAPTGLTTTDTVSSVTKPFPPPVSEPAVVMMSTGSAPVMTGAVISQSTVPSTRSAPIMTGAVISTPIVAGAVAVDMASVHDSEENESLLEMMPTTEPSVPVSVIEDIEPIVITPIVAGAVAAQKTSDPILEENAPSIELHSAIEPSDVVEEVDPMTMDTIQEEPAMLMASAGLEEDSALFMDTGALLTRETGLAAESRPTPTILVPGVAAVAVTDNLLSADDASGVTLDSPGRVEELVQKFEAIASSSAVVAVVPLSHSLSPVPEGTSEEPPEDDSIVSPLGDIPILTISAPDELPSSDAAPLAVGPVPVLTETAEEVEADSLKEDEAESLEGEALVPDELSIEPAISMHAPYETPRAVRDDSGPWEPELSDVLPYLPMVIRTDARRLARATTSNMSDQDFHRVWGSLMINSESSREGALLLLETFPGVYWKAVSGLLKHSPLGPAFGDLSPHSYAHRYMIDSLYGEDEKVVTAEYVLSRFDHCGYGPVALDALRYFVACRLSDNCSQQTCDKLIEEYAQVAKGDLVPSKLPQELKKRMFKGPHENQQILAVWDENDPDVLALEDDVETIVALKKAFFTHPRLANLRIQGVRRFFTTEAPTDRYWVRVKESLKEGEDGGLFEEDVIELRIMIDSPAVLQHPEALPMGSDVESRLSALRSEFWPTGLESAIDTTVVVKGKSYYASSLSCGCDGDLDELEDEEKGTALLCQVGSAANTHAPYWSKMEAVDDDVIVDWLQKNSSDVASWFEQVFDLGRENWDLNHHGRPKTPVNM